LDQLNRIIKNIFMAYFLEMFSNLQ